MVLLLRKSVIAIKHETTAGTAISLANADAVFNAYNVVMTPEITYDERDGQGACFGQLPAVPGAQAGTVTFQTSMAWDGTATEPSWADILLPACGFTKSTNVYKPKTEVPLGTTSAVKTLTIGHYHDGRLFKLRGCVGNAVFNIPTGRRAYVDWTFRGAWEPVTDSALLDPTYPGAGVGNPDTLNLEMPLRAASGTTTFDGKALSCEAVTIDLGNEIVLREDITTDAGYLHGVIVDRKIKITANPEAKLVATRDAYGDWTSRLTGVLSVSMLAQDLKTLTFSCPKAQMLAVKPGNRNKLITDDLEFVALRNDQTEDEVMSITFST
jgi:hypothetical protein